MNENYKADLMRRLKGRPLTYGELFKDDPASLIDAVLEQIKTDIAMGDLTAIEGLLMCCPEEHLLGYLPEEFLGSQL
jgi:hypothetical protein